MGKFGIKEVADVVFFDIETKAPVLFFDTLKVSSIENEAESAEARGGKGNANLMTWNYGRTATLTMQDALLSMESLSALAGTEVEEATVATGHERITVPAGGAVTLKNTPNEDTVQIYVSENGVLGDAIAIDGTTITQTGAEITGLEAGQAVSVFYEYEAPQGSTLVRFRSDAFPSAYRVVGDTVVRDRATGRDVAAQFVIPHAQLQAGFSMTMDVENVSVFDFNLNILKDSNSEELYQIIKLG